METCPLPVGGFASVQVPLSVLLSTSEDSDIGYIVEVDLDYPEWLHDSHSDFPLAPTKEVVQPSWLSDYQRALLEKHNYQPSRSYKLLQTLFNKEHYTLHYLTLKLYVDLGLQVTTVHRVLQFMVRIKKFLSQ